MLKADESFAVKYKIFRLVHGTIISIFSTSFMEANQNLFQLMIILLLIWCTCQKEKQLFQLHGIVLLKHSDMLGMFLTIRIVSLIMRIKLHH